MTCHVRATSAICLLIHYGVGRKARHSVKRHPFSVDRLFSVASAVSGPRRERCTHFLHRVSAKARLVGHEMHQRVRFA